MLCFCEHNQYLACAAGAEAGSGGVMRGFRVDADIGWEQKPGWMFDPGEEKWHC